MTDDVSAAYSPETEHRPCHVPGQQEHPFACPVGDGHDGHLWCLACDETWPCSEAPDA